LKRKISRVPSFIKEIHETKADLKNALIEHQFDMEPGLYWLDRSVAYRIGSPTPKALRNSKGYRVSTTIYPIKARIVRLIDAVSPPLFYRISSKPSSSKPNGQQLLSTCENKIKIFNLSQKTVTTYFNNPQQLTKYTKTTASLRRYLPILDLEKLTNSKHLGLTEPLIKGITFANASPTKQQ